MGLRNELRQAKKFKWPEWYGNMTAAADAVYKANPNLLIFFSGMDYDTQLNAIFTGKPMGVNRVFNKDELDYAKKIVLEVHDYDAGTTNCTRKLGYLTEDSFGALNRSAPGTKTVFPLVMSEWGFKQSPDQYKKPYASCLREIITKQSVGWMTWVLAGSYYIRSGIRDDDESWGLLDHEWKDWRCPECITKGLEPMVRATLGGKRSNRKVVHT
ncbi:MAG: hypothetical protein Q9211_000976 [Gyalolechia sp. 1 TL-2023]